MIEEEIFRKTAAAVRSGGCEFRIFHGEKGENGMKNLLVAQSGGPTAAILSLIHI